LKGTEATVKSAIAVLMPAPLLLGVQRSPREVHQASERTTMVGARWIIVTLGGAVHVQVLADVVRGGAEPTTTACLPFHAAPPSNLLDWTVVPAKCRIPVICGTCGKPTCRVSPARGASAAA
jgi:hypothetical protein